MVTAVFPNQDIAVATCVSCKASADVPCWKQLTGACLVHSAGLTRCIGLAGFSSAVLLRALQLN